MIIFGIVSIYYFYIKKHLKSESMKESWEYSTYANKAYIPFLEYCVKGFKHFTGISLKVYALDQETYDFAQSLNCETELISSHKFPQVNSLRILKECCTDNLLLIDADLWILKKDILQNFLDAFGDKNIAIAGHQGFYDIPYLFRGCNTTADIFSKIHAFAGTYPKFFNDWIKSKIIHSGTMNSGCVVNLPFIYGGLASFRTKYFHEMDIPDWIYSADLYLGAYCLENDLIIKHLNEFHFNGKIDQNSLLVHWIGDKNFSVHEEGLKYLDFIKYH